MFNYKHKGDNIMARVSIKNGKLLYHLTNIDNLDSILKNGLLPRNKLKELKGSLNFDDIADKRIIMERDCMGLGDYIPFHLHREKISYT